MKLAQRVVALMELILGRRDPPGIVARSVLGVLIPAMIVLYGLGSMLNRQAMIPSRGGLAQIFGLPAAAAGLAYAALGVILYVYVCWDDHPRFAGIRDAALQLLLIIVALSLAATFGLVLI